MEPNETQTTSSFYNTLFIDTNLNTHFALLVSISDTVSVLKKRIVAEHASCFPQFGNIYVHALKVKRRGHFYHLSDSMYVKSAFHWVHKCWFITVDVSIVKGIDNDREITDCLVSVPANLVVDGGVPGEIVDMGSPNRKRGEKEKVCGGEGEEGNLESDIGKEDKILEGKANEIMRSDKKRKHRCKKKSRCAVEDLSVENTTRKCSEKGVELCQGGMMYAGNENIADERRINAVSDALFESKDGPAGGSNELKNNLSESKARDFNGKDLLHLQAASKKRDRRGKKRSVERSVKEGRTSILDYKEEDDKKKKHKTVQECSKSGAELCNDEQVYKGNEDCIKAKRSDTLSQKIDGVAGGSNEDKYSMFKDKAGSLEREIGDISPMQHATKKKHKHKKKRDDVNSVKEDRTSDPDYKKGKLRNPTNPEPSTEEKNKKSAHSPTKTMENDHIVLALPSNGKRKGKNKFSKSAKEETSPAADVKGDRAIKVINSKDFDEETMAEDDAGCHIQASCENNTINFHDYFVPAQNNHETVILRDVSINKEIEPEGSDGEPNVHQSPELKTLDSSLNVIQNEKPQPGVISSKSSAPSSNENCKGKPLSGGNSSKSLVPSSNEHQKENPQPGVNSSNIEPASSFSNASDKPIKPAEVSSRGVRAAPSNKSDEPKSDPDEARKCDAAELSMGEHARTSSDNSSFSDYSVGEGSNDICSSQSGSSSQKRTRGGRRNSSKLLASGMSLEAILRSSSRFKKAKITATQSQLEDTESQQADLVPETQPIC